MTEDDIKKAGKRGNHARKISLYLLRKLTDMSNEEIAGYFGIGYTGVSQAAARIRIEMEADQRLKKVVQDIEKVLNEE